MVQTRRRWLLGLGAALLAWLGAFAFLGSAGDEPSARPPTDADAGLRWRAGTVQQYQLGVDAAFRMNAAGTTPQPPMRVQLDGVLQWRTLEVGAREALVGMQLTAVDLRIAGASDAATNRALGTPFRVRFTPQGLPTAFEFPAGLGAEHRGILENLLRMFQVVIRSGQAWVARETNASGTYEAAYARRPAAQVDKRKRRFLAAAPATGDAGLDVASIEAIRIDAGRDWIAAMTVDETVRIQGRGGPAIETSSRATLQWRPSAGASPAADTWAFAAAAAPPPTALAAAPLPRLPYEAARQQLTADVAALNAGGGERIRRVHHLRDLIRADGRLAGALLDALRARDLDDDARASLFLVLELAGSPPAQAALRSVAQGTTWSPLDHMRAVVALGAVARPTEDTVAALWGLAQGGPSSADRGQLAGTATLALGTAGNGLIAAKDGRYAALRAGLLNGALGAEAGPLARANFIHAAGNTGDASLSREIVPLLQDAAPAVRGAAAQTLGRLGTNEVADDLLRQFTAERHDVVRGAIAEALVSWTSPPAPALASMRAGIASEVDENTRYNIARLLGRHVADSAENRAVLQQLLRTEPSTRIRQQVAEALAAGR